MDKSFAEILNDLVEKGKALYSIGNEFDNLLKDIGYALRHPIQSAKPRITPVKVKRAMELAQDFTTLSNLPEEGKENLKNILEVLKNIAENRISEDMRWLQ